MQRRVVALQVQPVHPVPADMADSRVADTVDTPVADRDTAPVDEAAGRGVQEAAAGVAHSPARQQASPAAAPLSPGSGAMCCHSLNNARIYPSRRVDWQRCCNALRRLGRK